MSRTSFDWMDCAAVVAVSSARGSYFFLGGYFELFAYDFMSPTV